MNLDFMDNINIIADLEVTLKEKWLKLRDEHITGSDIHTLLGKRNYKSLKNKFEDKINGKYLDLENSKNAGNAIKFGTRNEDAIAHIFSTIYDVKIEEFDFMVTRKDNPILAANVDRLFKEDGIQKILEIKTGNEKSLSKWNEKVPNQYLYQLIFYLYVFDLRYGVLFGMIGGEQEKGKIRQLIRFDVDIMDYQELLERIIKRCRNFEKCLVSKVFMSEEEYKIMIENEKESGL